jgi:hypothetical protein
LLVAFFVCRCVFISKTWAIFHQRLINLCVFDFIQIFCSCFVLFFFALFLHLLEKESLHGLLWPLDDWFLLSMLWAGFCILNQTSCKKICSLPQVWCEIWLKIVKNPYLNC